MDKRYVFKNDGETSNELRKTFTESRTIMEKEEEYEEKEEYSENRPRNQDLSRSFRGSSNSGIKRKYFKREYH